MVNVTYTPDNDMVVTDDSGVATTYNLGDTAWIIVATALVWLMIPGVGYVSHHDVSTSKCSAAHEQHC